MTPKGVIAGGVIGVLVALLIGLFYLVAGCIFAACWNFVLPVLWVSAPHLTPLHGVAIILLIGFFSHLVRRK